MSWFTRRPNTEPRRARLSVNCLENRYAPASLSLFGQSTLGFGASPENVAVEISPTRQAPAVESLAVPPRVSEAAIGFFHVFAQNGFYGGEFDEIIPQPPRPRPVTPPALPVSFQQMTPADLFAPIPSVAQTVEPPAAFAPEIPRADPIEVTPPSPASPTPAEPMQPQRTTEPMSKSETAFDFESFLPSKNDHAAAITGLFAASYLATRPTRERRRENLMALGLS